MLAIVGYGSLINLGEGHHQKQHLVEAVPVKLKLFKRCFNPRPTWRRTGARASAVLNAQDSVTSWLNAICYCYRTFDFTALDERERGYTRIRTTAENLSCYQGYRLPQEIDIFIYLGKEGGQDGALLPNSDYLEVCLSGAKSWGDEFYNDFLSTTHINNGLLLSEYLQ